LLAFTHIYFSSPDCKYENDDGNGMLSFFIALDVAKIMEYFEMMQTDSFFSCIATDCHLKGYL
jgi:hypothetical protein